MKSNAIKTELAIIDSKMFISLIDKFSIEKRVSYMEAIIEVCGQYKIDLDDVAKLIPSRIKKLIENEANSLNMLKKKNKTKPLPI